MNTLTNIELFNANLKAKNYSERTISMYSCVIKKFIKTHGKSPENITSDEIVIYISKLKSSSAKRQAVGALRNFYTHVVGQSNKFKKIPYPKKDKKLPHTVELTLVRHPRFRLHRHFPVKVQLFALDLIGLMFRGFPYHIPSC
jgi:site-specific recombinase XerD